MARESSSRNPIRTFSEALRALDHVSDRSAKALVKTVKGELLVMRPDFKNAVRDFKEDASQKLHLVQDKAVEASRAAAHAVDQDAHRRPWLYVGVVALLGTVLGFLIGRKSGGPRG